MDSPLCPLYNHGRLMYPYVLGKPNSSSSSSTHTLSFVANTEPSAWDALPISKCPPLTHS